jgi:hypothetical protein
MKAENVAELLDEVRWFLCSYMCEAHENVVMSGFDVERAKNIEYAFDKLKPYDRTVLHLATGGCTPDRKHLRWAGLEAFDGFGGIVLGLDETKYVCQKRGYPDTPTMCKSLSRDKAEDRELIEELVQCAKQKVTEALSRYQRLKMRIVM